MLIVIEFPERIVDCYKVVKLKYLIQLSAGEARKIAKVFVDCYRVYVGVV